LSTLIDLKH
jgi:cell division cycle 2-like